MGDKRVTLATGEELVYLDGPHTYTINDRPCPGTHSLLERHGIVKPLDSWGAPYAERGKRVDFYTEAWDEHDLDIEDVDSSERGYLGAWIQFKTDHDFQVGEIQALLGSPRFWYATTIDRIGKVGGSYLHVNIKTGKPYKHHAIQLWLEELLIRPASDRIMAVYLDPSGTYKIEEFQDDMEARETALSIAETNGKVHRWMTTRRKSVKV